jgi:hypothetical protein
LRTAARTPAAANAAPSVRPKMKFHMALPPDSSPPSAVVAAPRRRVKHRS